MKDMSEEKDGALGDCPTCKKYIAACECQPKDWFDHIKNLKSEIEGNGGYKDMLKGFQFKIESLESRLKEALTSCADMSTPLGLLPINSIGMRKVVDELVRTQLRLSQAEAELDAVVKERDLYNEKYLELEKELSDFKKFHDEEFFGWEKLTSNLKAKLSQAEAENETLKLCNKNANALIADGADEAEKIVARLNARLSQAEATERELRENWLEDMQEWSVEKANLMDVAGKMAGALELVLKRGTQVQNSDQFMFEVIKSTELALAEWDGIKDGGK